MCGNGSVGKQMKHFYRIEQIDIEIRFWMLWCLLYFLYVGIMHFFFFYETLDGKLN